MNCLRLNNSVIASLGGDIQIFALQNWSATIAITFTSSSRMHDDHKLFRGPCIQITFDDRGQNVKYTAINFTSVVSFPVRKLGGTSIFRIWRMILMCGHGAGRSLTARWGWFPWRGVRPFCMLRWTAGEKLLPWIQQQRTVHTCASSIQTGEISLPFYAGWLWKGPREEQRYGNGWLTKTICKPLSGTTHWENLRRKRTLHRLSSCSHALWYQQKETPPKLSH